MPARLGVDIGGTFTDLVLIDEATGRTQVGKVLTNPKDVAHDVEEGIHALLDEAGVRPEEVRAVVHGTTLATNALIERKGARTALLTTEGFRDALEIGREGRYDMYALFIDPPPPLVPRHLRREVPERLLADGSISRALDDGAPRPRRARPRGRRGARHLPGPRLREPGARAAARRAGARRAARARRLMLVGGRARDPGVRARLDDLRQRLRGPAHGALPGGPRAAARRARGPGPALRHAVLGRHRAPAARATAPGPPGGVGPCRGRAGGGRGGARARRAEAPLVRHGRYDREGVRDRRRRPARRP